MLYSLEPEVAGGIGDCSKIIYENGRIKEIIELNFEFDGWLGDDLLTTSPVFIITENLANSLINSNLTGYTLDKVIVSKSFTFDELYPERELPIFYWLKPLGKISIQNDMIIEYSGHDINLCNNVDLLISEKAYNIFINFKLEDCDITQYNY